MIISWNQKDRELSYKMIKIIEVIYRTKIRAPIW